MINKRVTWQHVLDAFSRVILECFWGAGQWIPDDEGLTRYKPEELLDIGVGQSVYFWDDSDCRIIARTCVCVTDGVPYVLAEDSKPPRLRPARNDLYFKTAQECAVAWKEDIEHDLEYYKNNARWGQEALSLIDHSIAPIVDTGSKSG